MDEKEKGKLYSLIFYRMTKLKNSKVCQNIFFYLFENGPTQRKILIEKLKKADKVVWEALKKLMDAGVVEQVPTEGRDAVYMLSEEYRTMDFTQLFHFEKLREKEERVLWGYLGYGGLNEFMGDHTTYGLPQPKNLKEYDRDMATMALKMIDTGFRALQEVKALTEIRKEIERDDGMKALLKDGIFSYKLTLEYLLFFFSQYIRKMAALSNTPYEFLQKVKQKATEILNEENGNKITKSIIYDDYSQKYKDIVQQKSQCIESLFPGITNYGWKMDIAVLSTKTLALTEEHHQNVEAVLDKVFYQKNIDWNSEDKKVRMEAMDYIIRELWRARMIDDDKWKKNKLKFMDHKKLNKVFTKAEIETMASVIDHYLNHKLENIEMKSGNIEGITLSLLEEKLWEKPFHQFDIIHYILVYKLFQKDGPYYDEWIHTEVDKRISKAKKPYVKWLAETKKELARLYKTSPLKSKELWKLLEYLESRIFIEKLIK